MLAWIAIPVALGADLKLAATTRKSTFEVGETLLVDVTLTNGGALPFQFEQMGDDDGFRVVVVDAAGVPLPDPSAFGRRPNGGSAAVSQVAPGNSLTVAIDIGAHAFVDAPGTYSVRITALYPWQDPATPPTREIALNVVSPRDVPAAIARAPTPEEGSFLLPALGHAVFVPALETLALADPADARALAGLASCPCPAATDALFRLLVASPDPTVRARAASELLFRIPGAPREDRWLSSQSWDPDLAEALVALARGGEQVPAPPGYTDGVWGALVAGALGEEGGSLADSLATVAARHPGPALDPTSLTGLIAWDSRTTSPPPDWEDRVLRGLESPDRRVREVALSRVTAPASPAIARQIGLLARAHDVDVDAWLAAHPDAR